MDDGAIGELQPQVVRVAEHLHPGAMLLVVMERAPQGHVDEVGGTAGLGEYVGTLIGLPLVFDSDFDD